MAIKKKPVAEPNITYHGGPFPGRQVHWPEGKTESMQMRCGWEYGKYVLVGNGKAEWRVTLSQGTKLAVEQHNHSARLAWMLVKPSREPRNCFHLN